MTALKTQTCFQYACCPVQPLLLFSLPTPGSTAASKPTKSKKAGSSSSSSEGGYEDDVGQDGDAGGAPPKHGKPKKRNSLDDFIVDDSDGDADSGSGSGSEYDGSDVAAGSGQWGMGVCVSLRGPDVDFGALSMPAPCVLPACAAHESAYRVHSAAWVLTLLHWTGFEVHDYWCLLDSWGMPVP